MPNRPARSPSVIENRGHFPGDDAVIKLLWLVIQDIEDKRARQREKERARGAPYNKRKAPARLVESAVINGWKQALNALAIALPPADCRAPDPTDREQFLTQNA